jgi:hypothetical protein
MAREANQQLILDLFEAIESRSDEDFNVDKMSRFFHPNATVVWPPALPYGGAHRISDTESPSWTEVWNPLQPTAEERRMNPQFLGVLDSGAVVVRYRQRGRTGSGHRLNTEVLGIYEIRDQKLFHAQMYYFEETATAQFLAEAAAAGSESESRE